MKPVDSAYLAGLIDGEGCLSANGRTFKRPTIEICMTTPAPLFWASTTTGRGAVYPAKETRSNRRVPWKWVVCRAADILLILSHIKPYLQIKQPQAMALSILCKLRNAKVRKFGVREFAPAEDLISSVLRNLKQEDYGTAYQEALDLAVYLRQCIEERRCKTI